MIIIHRIHPTSILIIVNYPIFTDPFFQKTESLYTNASFFCESIDFSHHLASLHKFDNFYILLQCNCRFYLFREKLYLKIQIIVKFSIFNANIISLKISSILSFQLNIRYFPDIFLFKIFCIFFPTLMLKIISLLNFLFSMLVGFY